MSKNDRGQAVAAVTAKEAVVVGMTVTEKEAVGYGDSDDLPQ